MICYVCGKDSVSAGITHCPVCGFVNPAAAGKPEEFDSFMRQMAIQFRASRVGEAEIGMVVSCYEIDHAELVLKEEKELALIPRVCEMMPGRIYWNPYKFVKIKRKETIPVTVYVRKQGEKVLYEQFVTMPATEGEWHAGVVLTPDFHFRLVLGNEKKCVEAEKISLVSKK